MGDKIKSIYSEMQCGILLTDKNGNIVDINPYLISKLGYSDKSQLTSKKFKNLLTIGGKLFYETQHLPLVEIQGSASEINYELVCQDGTRNDFLFNSTLIQKEDEEKFQVLHVAFPFSDRKKYEKELLNAKKQAENLSSAKSDFLSTITHELKTPIHTVLGISDLLIQESPRNDQLEMLQLLQVSSLNLLELINSILEYNRIDDGVLKLVKKSFDLYDFLGNKVGVFNTQAKIKGIDLRLKIAQGTPRFFLGDEVKLGQVINNILGNSLKFTQEGTILVNVRSRKDLLNKWRLTFQIEDTGIGMSQEEIDVIFDPFTQGNESIYKRFGGTGLGLAITQKILKAHDSSLQVESIKGEGSSFSFDIRLEECEAPIDTKVGDFKTRAKKLKGVHVLVVDDNASNHFVIKRILDKWDVTYYLANGGGEALDALEYQKFDMILMDMHMPGLDGYETSKRIREHSEDHVKNLPIIAYTASADEVLTAKMKNAGFNDLITKPFRPDRLFAVLNGYRRGQFQENIEIGPASLQTKNPAIQMSIAPSMKEVLNIFEEDTTSMNKYLKAVMVDVNNLHRKLAQIKSSNSFTLSTFTAIAHSSVTICKMFNLDHIVNLFEKGKTSLNSNNTEEFSETLNDLIHKIDEFIIWLSGYIDE